MSTKYQEPLYSRNKVKKAGKAVICPDISPEEYNESTAIVNNWRASHAYPLQSIYVSLKRNGKEDYLYAQRLKRISSIKHKLNRWSNMKLDSMQDIGGCRIVVNSLDELNQYIRTIKSMKWNHILKEEYDYVSSPKSDGYRCYHLVYKFRSTRKKEYNDLLIEVQVRTKVQHLWSTAVETMDEIDNDNLKGGTGKAQNRTFFYLISQILQKYEESDYNAESLKDSAIIAELREFETENHLLDKLAEVRRTEIYRGMVDGRDGYFILAMDMAQQKTDIHFYEDALSATAQYESLESMKKDYMDIVLVSTESIDALEKAYPNYFSNIQEFVELMQSLIS